MADRKFHTIRYSPSPSKSTEAVGGGFLVSLTPDDAVLALVLVSALEVALVLVDLEGG